MWYCLAAHWHLGNVMVDSITFYEFCCFQCVTRRSVNMCINYSFLTFILVKRRRKIKQFAHPYAWERQGFRCACDDTWRPHTRRKLANPRSPNVYYYGALTRWTHLHDCTTVSVSASLSFPAAERRLRYRIYIKESMYGSPALLPLAGWRHIVPGWFQSRRYRPSSHRWSGKCISYKASDQSDRKTLASDETDISSKRTLFFASSGRNTTCLMLRKRSIFLHSSWTLLLRIGTL